MFIIYFSLFENELLKVETNSRNLRDILMNIPVFGQARLLTKTDPSRIIFTSRVGLFPRKITKKINLPHVVESFHTPLRVIFGIRTACGSKAEFDYLKRTARVEVSTNDDFLEYFLARSIIFIRQLVKFITIHGVWIKNTRKNFIFIGESGIGKTTLSRLLTEDKTNHIVVDDETLIIQEGKNIYAYIGGTSGRISHLFFIEKRLEGRSKVYPIPPKEAYKRIIFHSDVILNEKDRQINYRLNVLKTLVSQVRSFVLINGKGLQDDPKKLTGLINKALLDT